MIETRYSSSNKRGFALVLLLTAACSSSGAGSTGLSQGGNLDNSKTGDAGANGNSAQSGGGVKAPTGSTTDAGSHASAAPVIAIPKKGSIAVEVDDQGTVVVTCGGKPCACDDGIDNDADGVTDGFDAECTGPFDNDEGSFATGIPGDNRDPKWQDCFFDGNSGAGDDRCRYPTGCLDGSIDKKDERCAVAEQCRNACAPLAPPGCDCFGCCGVNVNGALHHIVISDSCSTEKIDDPSACTPCVQSASCQNECGECELCLGKTLDDLPAKCSMTPGQPPTPPQPSAPPSTDPPVPSASVPASGEPAPSDAPIVPPPPVATQPVPGTPPNTCDQGAKACSSNADCIGGYCSLGCCRIILQQ